jgi:hypothetical protein
MYRTTAELPDKALRYHRSAGTVDLALAANRGYDCKRVPS